MGEGEVFIQSGSLTASYILFFQLSVAHQVLCTAQLFQLRSPTTALPPLHKEVRRWQGPLGTVSTFSVKDNPGHGALGHTGYSNSYQGW